MCRHALVLFRQCGGRPTGVLLPFAGQPVQGHSGIKKMADGSFWKGTVVRSPDHPVLTTPAVRGGTVGFQVRRSKGFEGMVTSKDGSKHIVVGNDNNLPYSSSREPNQADDNELVLLEVEGLLKAR